MPMAQLLRAVKAGDGALIRRLLSSEDVASACRSLSPFDVNPLHVAVLALQVDAAAALLSFGLPFCAKQSGRVDYNAHGDGLGDVRRMLPTQVFMLCGARAQRAGRALRAPLLRWQHR